MPKVTTITPKEKLFVQKYLASGNISQSAMLAYDCKNIKTAYSVGKEVLEKPRIANYLSRLFNNFGLTEEKLTSDLVEIIEAGKINKDKATVKDTLRAIEMIFKLKGSFPTIKERRERIVEKQTLRAELRNVPVEELRRRIEDLRQGMRVSLELEKTREATTPTPSEIFS